MNEDDERTRFLVFMDMARAEIKKDGKPSSVQYKRMIGVAKLAYATRYAVKVSVLSQWQREEMQRRREAGEL